MSEPGPRRPQTRAPLALTMGEPAGIGGEIALAAWLARERRKVPAFFLIDEPRRLRSLAARLGWPVPIAELSAPAEATSAYARALPVLPATLPRPPTPGRPEPANAPAVLAAIERAVSLVLAGEAAAVVTNPIYKKVLYQSGFRHPGHTEYLADLADRDAGARGAAATPTRPVMMLLCPGLRVVPVTVHVPLRQAVAALDRETIVHAGRVTAGALARDLALAEPRLAVAGLNPHAGEGGILGREEIDIVAPAIQELRRGGIAASGPMAADTLFYEGARRGYDAALCMYHDQALIPLKTLDFEHGVNVTLGLPFVRTSPDHGTALAIAGQGKASPASLIAALETARLMAENRARADRPAVA